MTDPTQFSMENYKTDEVFSELLNDSPIEKQLQEGTIKKGIITAITNDVVVVDIGSAEGTIPKRQFHMDGSADKITVGDQIEVHLDRYDGRDGSAALSYEKVIQSKVWGVLEKALNNNENVDGKIVGRVKGGFTVDVGGIAAFLPGSQVDVRPVKDISALIGVTQPFQILKIDQKQGNIVVSRRAILEESRMEARKELLATIQEGQILEGVVKNITDYGAFIDLGSIDGLLHVTDISWSRISHPSEVLTLGQQVKVIVIKYNQETKRVSLGMKQLESNPWEGIDARYPKGSRCTGKVTNIADYGAFVELESGIEGLVHVSEVSWTQGNAHPRKLLTAGQEVEVMVLDIDPSKHRISLGIKQCSDNPWAAFASKHPVGTVLEGEVKNIVDFGVFVGFDDLVDGLVHVSDLTWGDDGEEILKGLEKDQKMTVKILGVDVEKERISLGVKQLSDDPMEEAFKQFKKGDVVTCSVTAVQDEGLEVELSEGMTAFIKRSDLSSERVEQRPERFAVGDRLDAKITGSDKSSRRVNLSIKALEIDEQKRAIQEYGSTDSGASLGDILGAALSKKQAEQEQKKSDS